MTSADLVICPGFIDIDKVEPHYVNYMGAKNSIHTTFGLGGVRAQKDR